MGDHSQASDWCDQPLHPGKLQVVHCPDRWVGSWTTWPHCLPGERSWAERRGVENTHLTELVSELAIHKRMLWLCKHPRDKVEADSWGRRQFCFRLFSDKSIGPTCSRTQALMSAVSPGQNISTDCLRDWVSHCDVPRRRAACAGWDTCHTLTLFGHVLQNGVR